MSQFTFEAANQDNYSSVTFGETEQQPLSYLDKFDPTEPSKILDDPQLISDLEAEFGTGKTKDELIDNMLDRRNWREYNTVGLAADIVDSQTGGEESKQRQARLQELYNRWPDFHEEGGRSFWKGAYKGALGALFDPLNLVGGVGGKAAAQAALRSSAKQALKQSTSLTATQTSRRMSRAAVKEGVKRGAISEAKWNAAAEALHDSMMQARDIELGIQDEFSALRVGGAGVIGGTFGGLIGAPFAYGGAKIGTKQVTKELSEGVAGTSALANETGIEAVERLYGSLEGAPLDESEKQFLSEGASAYLDRTEKAATRLQGMRGQEQVGLSNSGLSGDPTRDAMNVRKQRLNNRQLRRQQIEEQAKMAAEAERTRASTPTRSEGLAGEDTSKIDALQQEVANRQMAEPDLFENYSRLAARLESLKDWPQQRKKLLADVQRLRQGSEKGPDPKNEDKADQLLERISFRDNLLRMVQVADDPKRAVDTLLRATGMGGQPSASRPARGGQPRGQAQPTESAQPLEQQPQPQQPRQGEQQKTQQSADTSPDPAAQADAAAQEEAPAEPSEINADMREALYDQGYGDDDIARMSFDQARSAATGEDAPIPEQDAPSLDEIVPNYEPSDKASRLLRGMALWASDQDEYNKYLEAARDTRTPVARAAERLAGEIGGEPDDLAGPIAGIRQEEGLPLNLSEADAERIDALDEEDVDQEMLDLLAPDVRAEKETPAPTEEEVDQALADVSEADWERVRDTQEDFETLIMDAETPEAAARVLADDYDLDTEQLYNVVYPELTKEGDDATLRDRSAEVYQRMANINRALDLFVAHAAESGQDVMSREKVLKGIQAILRSNDQVDADLMDLMLNNREVAFQESSVLAADERDLDEAAEMLLPEVESLDEMYAKMPGMIDQIADHIWRVYARHGKLDEEGQPRGGSEVLRRPEAKRDIADNFNKLQKQFRRDLQDPSILDADERERVAVNNAIQTIRDTMENWHGQNWKKYAFEALLRSIAKSHRDMKPLGHMRTSTATLESGSPSAAGRTRSQMARRYFEIVGPDAPAPFFKAGQREKLNIPDEQVGLLQDTEFRDNIRSEADRKIEEAVATAKSTKQADATLQKLDKKIKGEINAKYRALSRPDLYPDFFERDTIRAEIEGLEKDRERNARVIDARRFLANAGVDPQNPRANRQEALDKLVKRRLQLLEDEAEGLKEELLAPLRWLPSGQAAPASRKPKRNNISLRPRGRRIKTQADLERAIVNHGAVNPKTNRSWQIGDHEYATPAMVAREQLISAWVKNQFGDRGNFPGSTPVIKAQPAGIIGDTIAGMVKAKTPKSRPGENPYAIDVTAKAKELREQEGGKKRLEDKAAQAKKDRTQAKRQQTQTKKKRDALVEGLDSKAFGKAQKIDKQMRKLEEEKERLVQFVRSGGEVYGKPTFRARTYDEIKADLDAAQQKRSKLAERVSKGRERLADTGDETVENVRGEIEQGIERAETDIGTIDGRIAKLKEELNARDAQNVAGLVDSTEGTALSGIKDQEQARARIDKIDEELGSLNEQLKDTDIDLDVLEEAAQLDSKMAELSQRIKDADETYISSTAELERMSEDVERLTKYLDDIRNSGAFDIQTQTVGREGSSGTGFDTTEQVEMAVPTGNALEIAPRSLQSELASKTITDLQEKANELIEEVRAKGERIDGKYDEIMSRMMRQTEGAKSQTYTPDAAQKAAMEAVGRYLSGDIEATEMAEIVTNATVESGQKGMSKRAAQRRAGRMVNAMVRQKTSELRGKKIVKGDTAGQARKIAKARPLTMAELGKVEHDLDGGDVKALRQILGNKTMEIETFEDVYKALDQIELKRFGDNAAKLPDADMIDKIVNTLESISDKIPDRQLPTTSRKQSLEQARNIWSGYHPALSTFAMSVIRKLGGRDDIGPELLDPQTLNKSDHPKLKELKKQLNRPDGIDGAYVNTHMDPAVANRVAINPAKTSMDGMLHEVAHWSYYNILSPQDRAGFWRFVKKNYVGEDGKVSLDALAAHMPRDMRSLAKAGQMNAAEVFAMLMERNGLEKTFGDEATFFRPDADPTFVEYTKGLFASIWKKISDAMHFITGGSWLEGQGAMPVSTIEDPDFQKLWDKIFPDRERPETALPSVDHLLPGLRTKDGSLAVREDRQNMISGMATAADYTYQAYIGLEQTLSRMTETPELSRAFTDNEQLEGLDDSARVQVFGEDPDGEGSPAYFSNLWSEQLDNVIGNAAADLAAKRLKQSSSYKRGKMERRIIHQATPSIPREIGDTVLDESTATFYEKIQAAHSLMGQLSDTYNYQVNNLAKTSGLSRKLQDPGLHNPEVTKNINAFVDGAKAKQKAKAEAAKKQEAEARSTAEAAPAKEDTQVQALAKGEKKAHREQQKRKRLVRAYRNETIQGWNIDQKLKKELVEANTKRRSLLENEWYDELAHRLSWARKGARPDAIVYKTEEKRLKDIISHGENPQARADAQERLEAMEFERYYRRLKKRANRQKRENDTSASAVDPILEIERQQSPSGGPGVPQDAPTHVKSLLERHADRDDTRAAKGRKMMYRALLSMGERSERPADASSFEISEELRNVVNHRRVRSLVKAFDSETVEDAGQATDMAAEVAYNAPEFERGLVEAEYNEARMRGQTQASTPLAFFKEVYRNSALHNQTNEALEDAIEMADSMGGYLYGDLFTANGALSNALGGMRARVTESLPNKAMMTRFSAHEAAGEAPADIATHAAADYMETLTPGQRRSILFWADGNDTPMFTTGRQETPFGEGEVISFDPTSVASKDHDLTFVPDEASRAKAVTMLRDLASVRERLQKASVSAARESDDDLDAFVSKLASKERALVAGLQDSFGVKVAGNVKPVVSRISMDTAFDATARRTAPTRALEPVIDALARYQPNAKSVAASDDRVLAGTEIMEWLTSVAERAGATSNPLKTVRRALADLGYNGVAFSEKQGQRNVEKFLAFNKRDVRSLYDETFLEETASPVHPNDAPPDFLAMASAASDDTFDFGPQAQRNMDQMIQTHARAAGYDDPEAVSEAVRSTSNRGKRLFDYAKNNSSEKTKERIDKVERGLRNVSMYGQIRSNSRRLYQYGSRWFAKKFGTGKFNDPELGVGILDRLAPRLADKANPIQEKLTKLPDYGAPWVRWNRKNKFWGKEAQPKTMASIVRYMRYMKAGRSDLAQKEWDKHGAKEQAAMSDAMAKLQEKFQAELKIMDDAGIPHGDLGPWYLPQVWDVMELERNRDKAIRWFTRAIKSPEEEQSAATQRASQIVSNIVDNDGVWLPHRQSAKEPRSEHTDFSRVININAEQLEEAEEFLVNDLEGIMYRYFDQTTRQQILVEEFGIGLHGFDDYVRSADGGWDGIREVLSGAKNLEREVKRAGDSMDDRGVMTVRTPIVGSFSEARADTITEALQSIWDKTRSKHELRTYLLNQKDATGGPDPKHSRGWERRVDAIVNAIADFEHKNVFNGDEEHDHLNFQMMDELLRVVSGRYIEKTPRDRKLNRASRTLRNFNNITLLGFTTLTSLTDLALPLVRSGSMRSYLKAGAKMAKDPDYREAIRNIGVAVEDEVFQRMVGIYGATPSRATNAFFNATMLTPWTQSMRKMGAAVATESFKAEGKKLKKGGVGARKARRYLAHFGLDEMVDRGNSLDDPGVMETEAFRAAVHRFVQESVFAPNQVERPLWTQTWWGSLMFQLKSFPVQMGRLSRYAVGETKEGNPWPLLYLATAAPAAGAGAMGVKDIVQSRGGDDDKSPEFRDRQISEWLNGLGFTPNMDEDTDAKLGWLFEATMHAGGLGMFGDLLYMLTETVDKGYYGTQRLTGFLFGPSASLVHDAQMILQGGHEEIKDQVRGENFNYGKERAAVRALAGRIPVIGGIRGPRTETAEDIADATGLDDDFVKGVFEVLSREGLVDKFGGPGE